MHLAQKPEKKAEGGPVQVRIQKGGGGGSRGGQLNLPSGAFSQHH